MKLKIATDILVFKDKKILLVKRRHKPFKNKWSLPGGFLEVGNEDLKNAAKRELKEETNLKIDPTNLELLNIYSSPHRDPRGHVISVAYIATKWKGKAKANSDAKELRFFSLPNLPSLAFDHLEIIKDYKNEA